MKESVTTQLWYHRFIVHKVWSYWNPQTARLIWKLHVRPLSDVKFNLPLHHIHSIYTIGSAFRWSVDSWKWFLVLFVQLDLFEEKFIHSWERWFQVLLIVWCGRYGFRITIPQLTNQQLRRWPCPMSTCSGVLPTGGATCESLFFRPNKLFPIQLFPKIWFFTWTTRHTWSKGARILRHESPPHASQCSPSSQFFHNLYTSTHFSHSSPHSPLWSPQILPHFLEADLDANFFASMFSPFSRRSKGPIWKFDHQM